MRMSKERLEEIKQTINHPNYTEHNGQEEIYYMVSDNDFNWLIQQAERAQEYDRELISLEDNKHYVSEMLAKNKRYREAIRECIERMNEGGAGTRSFVYERLIKVLEGEE